jgi:hypothetical protein
MVERNESSRERLTSSNVSSRGNSGSYSSSRVLADGGTDVSVDNVVALDELRTKERARISLQSTYDSVRFDDLPPRRRE